MDLRLLSCKGLPKDSLLSIRVGSCRQQAPINSQRPYKFPALATKEQMKVDVYVPLGHTRLLLEPGGSRFSVPLIPAPSVAEGLCSGGSMKNCSISGDEAGGMALEFEVNGSMAAAQESTSVAGREDEEEMTTGGVPGRAWSSRPSSASSFASVGKGARHRAVLADAQPYFEQHGVMNMMQALLQAVIKEKPADPSQYMIQVLQNSRQAAAGKAEKTQPQPTSQDTAQVPAPPISQSNSLATPLATPQATIQALPQSKRLNRPHSAGCLRRHTVPDGTSERLARPSSAIPKMVKFSNPITSIEEYTAASSPGGTSRANRSIPLELGVARIVEQKDLIIPAASVSTVVHKAAVPAKVVSCTAATVPVSADVVSVRVHSAEQDKDTPAAPSDGPDGVEQTSVAQDPVMSVADPHKDDSTQVAKVKVKVRRRPPQPSQATPQSSQLPPTELDSQASLSGVSRNRDAGAIDEAISDDLLQVESGEDLGPAREASEPRLEQMSACPD